MVGYKQSKKSENSFFLRIGKTTGQIVPEIPQLLVEIMPDNGLATFLRTILPVQQQSKPQNPNRKMDNKT